MKRRILTALVVAAAATAVLTACASGPSSVPGKSSAGSTAALI